MATRFQCSRIASLFIYSTTLANVVFRLLNLMSSPVYATVRYTQHSTSPYPDTVFTSFTGCSYARFRVSIVVGMPQTTGPETHFVLRASVHTEGVTLRCHARQFRLAVCCCVCCSQQSQPSSILNLSAQHSTAQHTAAQHTAAHGHHHIESHHIASSSLYLTFQPHRN